MRGQQIEAEWRRALKALRAAETLRAQDLLEDCVSRAYYALMHAAKAALLAEDVLATSHTAVRRLFGKSLVSCGLVEKEWAEILAREQDQRATADYNVDLDVEPEVAERAIRDAARFIQRMQDHLTSRGVKMPSGAA